MLTVTDPPARTTASEVSRRTRERQIRHDTRTVPADGSTLTDPRLGYLIAGFTDRGNVAEPGEAFTSAVWSRDMGGRCSRGTHAQCQHAAGGPHEGGSPVTGADGERHVWRCGCACHDGPEPQAYDPRGDKGLRGASARASKRPARPIATVHGPVQIELFGAST